MGETRQKASSPPLPDKLPGDPCSERLRLRFWLIPPDQQGWVGKGRIELLEAIARTGSIRQAARCMNMSYRRAWLLVEALNQLGPAPMVEKNAGGRHGGGTRLTPFGEHTLQVWKRVEQQLHQCAQDIERWLTWPEEEREDDGQQD